MRAPLDFLCDHIETSVQVRKAWVTMQHIERKDAQRANLPWRLVGTALGAAFHAASWLTDVEEPDQCNKEDDN